MKQMILKLLLCICMSVLCQGCVEDQTTTIIVASDLHYLSTSLFDDGEAFTSLVEHADGKYMPYIEEIVEAFTEEVIAYKPDYLLLLGDLTFNGEELSHQDLCAQLNTIEQAGVHVIAIPGNHDMENPYARRYEGEEVSFTGSISIHQYEQMYEDYGRDLALYKDTSSASFVVKVDENTWLIMLDVNACKTQNTIETDTLIWLEDVLEEGKKQGVCFISASHQNILQHSLFQEGFVIENAEEVKDLYDRYDVKLHLSGHMHIQSQKEENGLLECCVSALSVSPFQYGILTVDQGNASYITHRVDVSDWALRKGLSGYENFAQDGHDFFVQCGKNRKHNTGVSDELIDAYMDVNCAYFSGDMSDAAMDEEMLQAWYEADPFTWVYLNDMLSHAGNDNRSFTIDLK